MTSKQPQTKTLTDTQLVLLSAALQREDRGVVRPETMDARLFTRATKALLKAGLIAESATVRKQSGGAGSDGEAQMLVITAEGFNAIGIEEPGLTQTILGKPRKRFRKTSSRGTPDTATSPVLPDDSSTTRPTTKHAFIIAMLSRREGATLADLIAATGWLPHTTRAALNGLRQKGLCLERSKSEGEPVVYRIRDQTGTRSDEQGTGTSDRQDVPQAPALRHLHPRLHRPWAGPGLQLPRCPAGGGRGLYQEPGP